MVFLIEPALIEDRDDSDHRCIMAIPAAVCNRKDFPAVIEAS
jgi:hypothetical protein